MTRTTFTSRLLDVGWCLAVSAGVVGAYIALALIASSTISEPITATIVLGMAVVVLVGVLRWKKSAWLAYAPTSPPWTSDRQFLGHAMGAVLLAFLAGQTCAIWLYRLLGSENFDASTDARQSAGVALTLILTVLVAPMSEEALFRGVLYPLLRRRAGVMLSAVLSAALFGLVHGNLVQLTVTLPFAIVLALVYERTRALWVCVLLHMAFNVAAASPVASLVSLLANPVTAGFFLVAFIGVCLALASRVARAQVGIEA